MKLAISQKLTDEDFAVGDVLMLQKKQFDQCLAVF